MSRPFAVLALIVATGVLAAPAEAFRCGNRIVTEGDYIGQVVAICGEPLTVRYWTEVRVRSFYADPYSRYAHFGGTRHFRHRHHRSAVALPVEIQVEEWTYNLGARKFMRVLRFENGVLVRIRATDYGFAN